jgi:uncharacterized protein (DUF302 family)
MLTKVITTGLALTASLALISGLAAADLVRKESAHPVKETVDRLESIVTEAGFKVFARVDHAAGAKSVGKDLRPTELIIFGNPAGGTVLIQAEQTMGLTLPLKVLTWQDEAGKTWIGYDEMSGLAAARGVAKDHPVVQKIGEALNGLTGAAAK